MAKTNYKNDVQTEPALGRYIIPGNNWHTVTDPQRFLGYRCEIRLVAEKQGYSTYVAQLPGAVSQGDDAESTGKNTIEAIQGCIRACQDNNMPIPWSEPEDPGAGEVCFWVEVNV